jgi:GT2 family glycosyltransferase
MGFLRDPLMSSHGKLSLEARRVSIATMQHESHGPSGSPISTLGDSRLPSVAIVLVNWNSWRHTIECLDALLAQTYTSFCVFVVDNDSQDQSIEHISEWCAKPTGDSGWLRHAGVERYCDRASAAAVRYRLLSSVANPVTRDADQWPVTLISTGKNLGFAGGCNVGIRWASLEPFDYYWLLNTDTVVCRDALAALLRRAEREPKPGMIGSTILYYDRPGVIQALGGGRLGVSGVNWELIGQGCRLDDSKLDAAGVEREISYVMGASMLISTQFIRDVGLMQDDYFLYYEEIDWAMRGRGKYAIGYAPDSFVFHKSGASSSKVIPMFTANLYYRNSIRFMSRFFPERMGALRRRLLLEVLRYGLKGEWALSGLVFRIWRDAQRIQFEATSSIQGPQLR